MDVRLRAYEARDFDFARRLYFETMRWAIERVFDGMKLGNTRASPSGSSPRRLAVITADGLDVGWIQQRLENNGILLGSIYVAPAMQRKGIGSGVIQALLEVGRQKSQTVTLAVMSHESQSRTRAL
jgi:GNAT superfamily N-acetyltransferase